MENTAVKTIVKDEENVVKELCALIEKVASESVSKKGSFKLGVSGGSMAKFVCNGLPKIKSNWAKWSIFFCDERLVPFSNADSTFRLYSDGLVGKTPLTKEQFIVIKPELEVTVAASDYESQVRSHFPECDWPKFDMLLLGMGPDGHTASLFPDHPLLQEKKAWVAPISDSPKPPPCRVTLTLPAINNASYCVFAMAGQGKADMVKRVLGDCEPLPSALVKPVGGNLVWILDEAAASKL